MINKLDEGERGEANKEEEEKKKQLGMIFGSISVYRLEDPAQPE